MANQVLIVDDDPHVLDDSKGVLRREFRVETACGCRAGLATLHLLGPFAIVISHLRLSGLDGVEFLDRVRELAPHAVRILLARNKDLKRARAAMNEGRIFRYLETPCKKEGLASVIRLGLVRYRANVDAGELMKEETARSLNAAGQIPQELFFAKE
jgi:DNA-binding NtrC family response regulator